MGSLMRTARPKDQAPSIQTTRFMPRLSASRPGRAWHRGHRFIGHDRLGHCFVTKIEGFRETICTPLPYPRFLGRISPKTIP